MVQVTDIQTPAGFEGSIPDDFYWKIERVPGGVIHDWASLTDRDMVNNPFTIETVTHAGMRLYNAGYKYILDEQDIPGHYLVEFTYTVTAP
jgi:hypothetical protein